VWKWDQTEPFGSTPPNDNPSGLGAFDFPLRFPGQYFGRERGLAYNYYRDYDPNVGRYIQSDLIGLRGGANTYSYVRANPSSHKDRSGLVTDPDSVTGLSDDFMDFIRRQIGRKGANELEKLPGYAEGIACANGLSCALLYRDDVLGGLINDQCKNLLEVGQRNGYLQCMSTCRSKLSEKCIRPPLACTSD